MERWERLWIRGLEEEAIHCGSYRNPRKYSLNNLILAYWTIPASRGGTNATWITKSKVQVRWFLQQNPNLVLQPSHPDTRLLPSSSQSPGLCFLIFPLFCWGWSRDFARCSNVLWSLDVQLSNQDNSDRLMDGLSLHRIPLPSSVMRTILNI